MRYECDRIFCDMKEDFELIMKVVTYKSNSLENFTNNYSIFYCEFNLKLDDNDADPRYATGEIESLEYSLAEGTAPIFIKGKELIDLIEEVKSLS